MVCFEFGFNNPHFSDRKLSLQMISSNSSDADEGKMSEGHAEDTTVGTLHVNSLLLAAHSNYFMSLFSNGMSESCSEIVSVKLAEEEIESFYHLIQYMYTEHLNEPTDIESTITLLRLADRFAITSCLEVLVHSLQKLPNTLNGCLLVLGLPESLKCSKTIQPAIEHFSSYLTQYFVEIPSRKSEFLSLSLEAVKVVLDSDNLNVSYEEEVFYYMLDWLNDNCKTTEEQTYAAKEIASAVRFPWMTGDFLEDVIGSNSLMENVGCQQFILEALKFKSFTHARQQQMMFEKANHNRFRPRNNLILENFWGSSKTHTIYKSEQSCQVYFEFPLELVICTGQSFQSRPFCLAGRHTFFLEAVHGQVRTSYNQQLTCFIRLALPASILNTTQNASLLRYAISMKRDYAQNYDIKATAIIDLSSQLNNRYITFTDLFSGWFIERGFSFPRWNLTINGPVHIRLDLSLHGAESQNLE